MLDPADGSILWESDALASSFGSIVVEGDIAIGNVVKDLSQIKKKASQQARVGGARINTKGAELIWSNDQVHHVDERMMNIIGGQTNQFFINDSRISNFQAIDIQSGQAIAKLPHIYHITQGSHNWTWHIAAADRIITSGVAMFHIDESGMRLLPGRLSLDLSSGYRSPTKPAFADGRIVLRLADKLVCYDLRQAADDTTEVVQLTAYNAVPSAASQDARDLRIHLRKRGDQLFSAGARVGRQAGPEKQSLVSWAGDWTSAMPWRKTIPDQLTLDDDGLSGAVIRMGWQYEPFELNLQRDGDAFSGTYARIISALAKPFSISGTISGSIKSLEGGQKVYHMHLPKSVGNLGEIKNGIAGQGFTAYIVVNEDGSLSHGWGAAGRMNTVTHEVDASGLSMSPEGVTGEIKVIVHDDQYQDLNYHNAVAKMAPSADGPALGITYQVDVKVAGRWWRRASIKRQL